MVKKKSLKIKLVALLLTTSIIPIVIIGLIGLKIGENSIVKIAFEKLESNQTLKKAELITLYKTMESEFKVVKVNPLINDIMLSFNNASKQSANSVKSSNMQLLAKKWDGFFSHICKELEWYDAFLITKEGFIAYTFAKESDYGAFLTEEPLKSSPLGEVFNKLKNFPDLETSVTDFEPYTPSNNIPAAFMMTPLKQNGEVIGYMAFQLSDKRINNLMLARDGLGETGETYLVGSDFKFRSDSFLDKENRNVNSSANGSVEKNGANTESVQNALKGESGNIETLNYLDDLVLSSYSKVNVAEDINWVIVAEESENEILASIYELKNIILLLTFGLILGLIFIGIYGANYFINPIKMIVDLMISLSKGDLTQKSEIKSNDELGILRDSVNSFIDSLRKIVQNVKQAEETLSNAASQLAEASDNAASSVTEVSSEITNVASATEQLSANINNISATAEEMSVNAKNVAKNSEKLEETTSSVASAVEEMSISIEKVSKNANEESKIAKNASEMSNNATITMKNLGIAANEIGKVTEVIKRIAEQTNLLALNATIEAASAGDAGTGFAVVANEIKELANQSAKAAEDIASRITGVQKNTSDAINIISEVSEVIQTLNEFSEITQKSLEQQSQAINDIASVTTETQQATKSIKLNIAEVATGSEDLAKNTAESATGANQISASIHSIDETTNNISATSEEVNISANHLKLIADELKLIITQFKI